MHEAAHVFHNCKRSNLGLTETQSKVWLLDIEYRKRERLRIREKPMRAYSTVQESPEMFQATVAGISELNDLNPTHAAYVYAHNMVSELAEHCT